MGLGGTTVNLLHPLLPARDASVPGPLGGAPGQGGQGAEEEVLAHAGLLHADGGGRGGEDALVAALLRQVVQQLLDGSHLERGHVRLVEITKDRG